jgi:tRNA-specific 2-thiouridylase
VARKNESQDLCFLGDGDYRRFLDEYAPDLSQPGPIVTRGGEEVGRHDGLPHYTIGQRKGLGLAAGQPLFVLAKDTARNALVVGGREELGRRELLVRDVNWVAGESPGEAIRAQVKIRYKARPAEATVTPLAGERAMVLFDEPVAGSTAGQGAVFYQGDLCLGGGLIADPAVAGEEMDA